MFKRFCVGLSLVALAGCSDVTPANVLPFLGAKAPESAPGAAKIAKQRDRSKEALVKTRLSQGGVTLKGPDGYCIDKKSVRRNSALLVSCAAFNEQAPVVPDDIGALRLSVGKAGPDTAIDVNDVVAFLSSDAGRTALSRSGDPSAVEVEETLAGAEAIYVRVLDASPSAFGKQNSTEWRALTKLNGHLSVASVSGYGNIQITEAAGLRLLKRFVAGLNAENPNTVSKKETKNPLNALLKRVKG